MVELLTAIYLAYMFAAFYFLFLFVLIFVQNRKEVFECPKPLKNYSLSVVIPAYNEQESVKGTVEAVLASDYPYLEKVIIVNDGSKDDTEKISAELEKKYKKVQLFNKLNSGKADSINQALKLIKSDYVAVVDADSYPRSDAISKMIGFFNEEGVGAVTTSIIVREPKNFIQRMQAIEYKVIAFTRKLLGFVDSIYVTPGPLAIYDKKVLISVGGFDTKNMTEDIELTWKLVYNGYKIRMSFDSYASTVSPDTIKKWFKQRTRWGVGGMQTMLKYKASITKKGMLGFFILPFFSLSLILGFLGLGLFSYRFIRGVIVSYLSTEYSITSNAVLLSMQDINLHPSILHFFGITAFILGILFILFSLHFINKKTGGNERFFSLAFYSLIYMTVYPIVLAFAFYKFVVGGYTWR